MSCLGSRAMDVASVLCLPFRISLLHQYRPSVAARDPRGTCKRYTGNGRRLDRQGHQVLALEVMHVLFATRPGDHGQLHVESLEIVAYPARANRRLQALFQNRVLGRHADRTLTGLAVMAEPRCGAELVIVRGRGDLLAVLDIAVRVATQSHEHTLSDRHSVGAESESFGNISAGANASRDDELHFLLLVEVLQCIDGLAYGRKTRYADVLDEGPLGRCSSALHAIDNNDICAGVDCELHVMKYPRCANLHVDRRLPVGDLAELLDLDGQINGSRPVGVAGC